MRRAQIRDGGLCFTKHAIPEKDGAAENVGTLRRSDRAQNERKSAGKKKANERNIEKRTELMAEMECSNIATSTFSRNEREISFVTKNSIPSRKNT